jgi:hypothetical protein
MGGVQPFSRQIMNTPKGQSSADNIQDTAVVPHVLCSTCTKSFASSKTLRATFDKGHNFNTIRALDPAKRKEDELQHKIQQIDEKLKQIMEVLQWEIDHKSNPDAPIELQKISSSREKFRSRLRVSEYLQHHENLQGLRDSVQRNCHFCTIIETIINGTDYKGLDNRGQDTAVGLSLVEWPSFATLELHLSRDDTISLPQKTSRRLQSRMSAEVQPKSGESLY